jgi:hypothetical protein
LAFSIFRYRLWDIDRLIRRTALYTLLTLVLAALYGGSILLLQSGFRTVTGQAQNQAVTVLSTLFIAALAGPLRARFQAWIDRRFNRPHYDAARTLAAFGQAVRDDVQGNPDRLKAQLLDVVHDTLEPENVSLWLRS